jgi:hypothetical protein
VEHLLPLVRCDDFGEGARRGCGLRLLGGGHERGRGRGRKRESRPTETRGLRLERGEAASTERWRWRLRVFLFNLLAPQPASALRLTIPVRQYLRLVNLSSLPPHCPHSTLLLVLSPTSRRPRAWRGSHLSICSSRRLVGGLDTQSLAERRVIEFDA